MDMNTINWLAILVSAISAFVVGGIWYSPSIFSNPWMKDNNLTQEIIKNGNKAKIFGWAFLFTLIAAANLGMFLADSPRGISGQLCTKNRPGLGHNSRIPGRHLGLLFCSHPRTFEHSSRRLIFINGGYAKAALTLMEAIIGLWR